MAKVPVGHMETKRILLSPDFSHLVRLSEQQMGVICHALDTLGTAFGMETEYAVLILETKKTITSNFDACAEHANHQH